MNRFRFLVLAATTLLLVGCGDSRRDLAREHLLRHAPAGFEVVSVPETLRVRDKTPDSAELVVPVHYRSTAATVEQRDGFLLPAAREVEKRFADLRGWALNSLPADAPLRTKFLAAIADAHTPFPVKRIVSPAGSEVEALTTVSFRREASGWQVADVTADIFLPGAPDADSRIPLEDSPETAARVAELTSLANHLEIERREYLAARKAAAERSEAQLRALVRTGQTFTAELPDGTGLRLVVTRGFDSDDAPVVVVSAEGPEVTTARFIGRLESAPSGEVVWRSGPVTTLSRPTEGVPPAVADASRTPAVELRAVDAALAGTLLWDGQPAHAVRFRPAGKVELLPEPDPAPSRVSEKPQLD